MESDHRGIKVGKDLWDHLVQLLTHPHQCFPLSHVPEWHSYQRWWLHHPGQPVPVPHRYFRVEIFPRIWPKSFQSLSEVLFHKLLHLPSFIKYIFLGGCAWLVAFFWARCTHFWALLITQVLHQKFGVVRAQQLPSIAISTAGFWFCIGCVLSGAEMCAMEEEPSLPGSLQRSSTIIS